MFKQLMKKEYNTFERSSQFDVLDVVTTDHRLRVFTGLPNMRLFNVIVNALNKCAEIRISCIRQLLLTLIKIRLGLTFRVLAILLTSVKLLLGNTFILHAKC